MSKFRVLAVTTVLCILAGTAVSPARASLTDLWASERQQKRDTSDLRPYEEETSGLIAQFRILATSLVGIQALETLPQKARVAIAWAGSAFLHANALAILLSPQKETMVNKLNVTNGSTLDPPSETTEVSFLRSALGTLCTMKPLLTALVAAEASVTAGVQFMQDREISTMQIIVAKLYQQTCEWVRNLLYIMQMES